MTDRAPRPLTLRDVSAASGVSEMTVSRVLRKRGDVSEATRDRVLAAAKALGYVPNQIAGSLASQRVNLVAVIIPSLSNMVFPEVLNGVNQVLEDTPLQPVVGVTDYMPEKEERVLYEMLSWRPSVIPHVQPEILQVGDQRLGFSQAFHGRRCTFNVSVAVGDAERAQCAHFGRGIRSIQLVFKQPRIGGHIGNRHHAAGVHQVCYMPCIAVAPADPGQIRASAL